MMKEFSGKTEKEAINKAIEELGINREEFDVEIVESFQKGFFFKKNEVKIRIHLDEEMPQNGSSEPQTDYEKLICAYVEGLLSKMNYPGKALVSFRDENKIGISIESEHSSIIIGKKGKNLDAIQVLVNVYSNKISEENAVTRVIVDAENYRSRREENLIRNAQRVADRVRKTKKSQLLEPMNPFERRLIHTSLSSYSKIFTQSEGEGLLKQVRIIYKEEIE